MVRQVFSGSMIHAHDNGEVIFRQWAAIFVEDGKIINVMENHDQQTIDDFHADKVNNLLPGQFIIPGFIDCHTYAVQYPNIGIGYGVRLLYWLESRTYPLEEEYVNQHFAEEAFDDVVKLTLTSGTTTACYSGSLYHEASTILAKKCSEIGQRAFVGKINMNTARDDGYYESTEISIANTKAFIESVENMNNPLVQPIITPRSALTCDMELLQSLEKIAADKNLRIQSNISQDPDEVKAVKHKFGLPTYTDVYKTAGLLSLKTSLAHGNNLSDYELKTLARTGTTIIHCPTSNINLESGLCDVRKIKNRNIVVGLGTDISGGSNLDILNEMKSVLDVSNTVATFSGDKVSRYVPLNYKDVFVMATIGGAKALSIEDKVGNFKKGKEFDALIIDLNAEESFIDNFREYTLEERLQRFIYSGTFHNIISIYVKGEKIDFEKPKKHFTL
ncbi:guanine deaminase-like [Camponotus floridanus]|uniref:guanine deaminase-like n=1 Tax=Camponotus floridanus TaxID=104421 RepID=UPI000DC67A58|nr:guanine deaminase-like [Camponotus floridanus]